MNRRLARYLASEIALCTGFTLLMLVGLFAFFDLLNEIDDIGKGGYRFIDALIYLTFTLPGTAYELLPVSVLIGGIYALSTLASNSELTVMRVSGVSLLRLTGWLAATGAAFALLTGLVGEYVAPAASKAGSRYHIQSTKKVLLGDTRSGIWIKDGKQIANVAAMLPDMTLQGLRIYEFDETQRLVRITDSAAARYNEDSGHWQLHSNSLTEFPADKQQIVHSVPNLLPLKTSLNPDMLSVFIMNS